MKKLNKLLLLVLGFAAGLLSGAFIRLGFEIINGRPSAIGGEALILPLIVLLLCFGCALGKEAKVQRRFDETFRRGLQAGYTSGYVDGVENLAREFNAEMTRRAGTLPADNTTIASGQ